MSPITKTETYTFKLTGDQTVMTASRVMDRLPNGWTLKSFEYVYPAWCAVAEGPVVDLDEPPGT